jgi:hypothetical protein
MKTTRIIFTAMIIALCSCHSPKKLFKTEAEAFKSEVTQFVETFSAQDIAHLPAPVVRYIKHCGYVGALKPAYAEVFFEKSRIKLQPDRKWMKLKTHQFNFVAEPARLAYMKAVMMGVIPFEGRDKYSNGHGHMFGVIGGLVKVFDAKEPEIAQGAAIVLLAEALLIPAYALQDYIVWEPVDERTANARFVHKGVDVGGTFHFNESGEYIRFTSNDRPFMNPDGTYTKQPYTIEIRSYQQQGEQLIAKDVAAIWNLPQGDYEYWTGTISEIRWKP